MPYPVAVVSDGSARTPGDPARRAGSVEPVLRHWAALIHEHTGQVTRPVHVAAQDAENLGAGLRGLPPDTGALLTTLNRRGLSPEHGRVVIAGAATMPLLCPLLVAAGFGCVTSWDRRDAVTFPLRCITQAAEAVIDLLGGTRELAEAAEDHPELIIITPDKTNWALLALPGLLHAVTTAQHPRAGVEDYHACALALAAATPPDRRLPDPTDRALTSTVEQAATRAQDPARSCESVDPCGPCRR